MTPLVARAVPALEGKAGKPMRLDWLPLACLRVDPRYQREIDWQSVRLINRIAAQFRWSCFTPLIVARVPGPDGLHMILDGQHRATAALSRGFDKVPCAIVEAGFEEAAAIFAAINGERKPINAMQVYKAALAAHVDWAVAIKAACDRAGIEALTYPVSARNQKPYMTNALGRMRQTVQRHGADVLQAALTVIRAQPHAAVPGFINSKLIEETVAEVLQRPDRRQTPLDFASARVAALSRNAAIMAGPAPEKPVPAARPAAAMDEAQLAARIADLKARHFTKSMVAATLKCRHALVEKLWGGA